jgi:TonB family protein
LHGFAVLLLVFGSAFFVAKEKPQNFSKLQFVPSRFVESALAGGGGNPNLPRSDDQIKGETLVPQPAPTPPAPKAQPQPTPPEPVPDPPRPEPPPTVKKQPTPKAVEPAKPKVTEKAPPVKPRIDLSELKPVPKDDRAKAKAKAESEAEAQAAKEAKAAAQRQIAAANAARQRLAQKISGAAESLRAGFSSGVKMDVGGPGGEAYANYGALVQMAYESAWQILPDLDDNDAVAVVRVTIARDGRVIDSKITRKSTSTTMDRSVIAALNKVKAQGLPPFPDFIHDSERSFTIEFNLKARRLSG